MRVFETANDLAVLPGIHIVARIDGRTFTQLAQAQGFERPFDERFRDHMIATTEHLMTCDFR
jgi:tRNA(His) 5'-end guanylyltransferase